MQDNKKDIQPINDKDLAHGYWEVYWSHNKLWYKRFFINGLEHGHSLLFGPKGKINEYYVK
jgi:hypothetical protein